MNATPTLLATLAWLARRRPVASRPLGAACALLAVAVAIALGACGGGSSTTSPSVQPGTPACTGACASAASSLSVADVERVLARAIVEAQQRGTPATIAVVDRVGNVLAVFRMNGADDTVTLRTTSGSARVDGGLENIEIVPATMAAISKAVTGAYLSSEGNAFSTRTASQIVQSHFNPGEFFAPSGPLFGVQFSQLPCSDLLARFAGGAAAPGPHRAPLGLAADPGGFPLYREGTVVGGVGVIADRIYGLDANVQDRDADDTDEAIALAAAYGLAAPDDRRADRITADGKTLRFSDVALGDLRSTPESAASFASVAPAGVLLAVPGYSAALVVAGTAFQQAGSGLRADTLDFAGLDAFVLVDASNTERYRPRAGSEGTVAITADEARALLGSALRVANQARAQIRRPLDSSARVSISLVDSTGTILGIVRSRDAPVFGIDVSLQKARTAAFMSSANAASALASLPPAIYLDRGLAVLRAEPIDRYVTALRAFTALPTVLADGEVAFTARAIGNLARPFYPDGVDAQPAGPLSKRAGEWSPFSTGLQLDLVYNALIQHVAFVAGLAPDVSSSCPGVGGFDAGFVPGPQLAALANGLQVFPGGVPLYRNGVLVGALGVSGDGVDQDDMIAFLGAARAGIADLTNAPPALRADRLVPQGTRLRYVSCPQSPFLGSNEQEPCGGL